ncbi:unnamed protein product [Clonostachys rosea f. rosea IK726]|uniref:Uncharacterized protein n=1 Tax=Clonostachys rosea f. rosea IK726 TaxID=1349383 RepID=A0ACA9UDM5_BIOOC|nr:unnamed protein product [Clonostachys rosea f. rosea IK726]
MTILPLSLVYRSLARRFIEKVLEPSFQPADALRMLYSKNTIDFGSARAGGAAAKIDDEFFPSFYLDFLSIVGKPGLPIIRRDGPILDNVTVSFRNWAEPYGAKHVSGIQFDLTGRTFRIAEAATREKWFIVMHPRMSVVTELPSSAAQRQQREDLAATRSGLPPGLAHELAAYITDIFQEAELVGEGIEPCWRPGSRHSQRINSDRWAAFQELFMTGWTDWADRHAEGSFWLQHVPAFHAYDYGANIEIKVHQRLYTLPRERHVPHDDSDTESSVSSGEDDDGDRHDRASSPSDAPTRALPSSVHGLSQQNNSSSAYDEMIRESEGLRKLDEELSARFCLDNIAAVSYALAICINSGAVVPHASPVPHEPALGSVCSVGQEDDGNNGEGGDFIPRCLLIDRNQIAQEYARSSNYNFYSQAFSPVYSNVSSSLPPAFLHSLFSAMQGNISIRHDGADVLSFGYFQGYSNIKRNVRHSPRDLLATKGYATAALTVPAKEACAAAVTARKRERSLRAIRGQQTANAPAESKPFVREHRQINAAIDASEVVYRLEQVVSLNTANLRPEGRTFETVLRPIFQLMRFFLREHESYVHIFRSMPLEVFPGIMGAYARLFELALEEMDRRYVEGGERGLDLAHSEGVAVLDRLGGYLFTGFERHLPKSVLRPLGTIDGLRGGGWPYIDPEVLDLCAAGRGGAVLDMARWPRYKETGRPILLHVAELRYHYGDRVASSRDSNLWFAQLGNEAFARPQGVAALVTEVIGKLWMSQTKAFMQRQLRRRLTRVGGAGPADAAGGLYPVSGEAVGVYEAAISAWSDSENAFAWSSLERLIKTLASQRPRLHIKTLAVRTRYNFARELFRTASCERGWTSLAAKEASWPHVLYMAIAKWRHARETTTVSSEEWVAMLTKSLLDNGIEWVPGSSGGRISSTSVVRVQGHTGAEVRVSKPAGPVGSLRRTAQEAEMKHELVMRQRAQQALERKTRRIDFECSFPFRAIPPLIYRGFSKVQTLFAKGDGRVLDHYHCAMNCLAVNIEDPLCHLMLMLVLTVCSSSEMPFVEPRAQQFSTLLKRKDAAQVALGLATRMMWFLYPKLFPWDKSASSGVYNVWTIAKKLGL